MIHIKNYSSFSEKLRSEGVPHLMSFTNKTVTIQDQETGKKYLSGGRLNNSTLGFISRVKKYADSVDIPVRSGKPSYFQFSNIRNGIIKNAIEVDVNGAYWNLAHKSGIINDSLYQEGLKVPKMDRLIALGSLATCRKNFEWNPDVNDYERLADTVNEKTRSYFFHVAIELDAIMKSIFKGGRNSKVYWYWVDAFFVDRSLLPKIQRAVKLGGLEVKIKEVDYIRAYNLKPFVQCIDVHMKGEKEPKPFIRRTGSESQRKLAKLYELKAVLREEGLLN